MGMHFITRFLAGVDFYCDLSETQTSQTVTVEKGRTSWCGMVVETNELETQTKTDLFAK